MDRQTLRDWAHRYNARDRRAERRARSGRPSALSEKHLAELKELVLAGPDLAHDGVVRSRCVDRRSVIRKRYDVVLHERTAGNLLRRIGMTRVQPRPYHPKKDADAQTASKTFVARVAEGLPPRAAGKRIEIWFQDEACVGQQGTLSYIWASRDSRPAAIRDNHHASAYLFGAICPDRAVAAATAMPWVSSEATTIHLAEIAKRIIPDAHGVLICDSAGWHQTGERLSLPANISLLQLPPYAPELSPMENVWEYLRGNQFSTTVWDSYTAIVDACRVAWNTFITGVEGVILITSREWASVNS